MYRKKSAKLEPLLDFQVCTHIMPQKVCKYLFPNWSSISSWMLSCQNSSYSEWLHLERGCKCAFWGKTNKNESTAALFVNWTNVVVSRRSILQKVMNLNNAFQKKRAFCEDKYEQQDCQRGKVIEQNVKCKFQTNTYKFVCVEILV